MWSETFEEIYGFSNFIYDNLGPVEYEEVPVTYTVFQSKPIQGIILELTSVKLEKVPKRKQIDYKAREKYHKEKPGLKNAYTIKCVQGDMMLRFVKNGYTPINGPFYYKAHDLVEIFLNREKHIDEFYVCINKEYPDKIQELCSEYLRWLYEYGNTLIYDEIYQATGGMIK